MAFTVLVLAFVEEGILIRIRKKVSSFTTLGRDRFEDFFKVKTTQSRIIGAVRGGPLSIMGDNSPCIFPICSA